MTPAQRQLIKEAYMEGYNEATHLSDEELEEAIGLMPILATLGRGALAFGRRPIVSKTLGASGVYDSGSFIMNNAPAVGKAMTPKGPFPGGYRPF
jgi:hypothetical protein